MYWLRRRGGKVYVYGRGDKQVPRARTRHLDVEPDHNVQAWVDQWARQYADAAHQAEHRLGSELAGCVERYLAYLRDEKQRHHDTVRWHGRHLRTAVEFFLAGDQPLTDPQQWPARARDLYPWLVERGASASVVTKTNVALTMFYTYLVEVERRVQPGLVLHLRTPLRKWTAEEETPLRFPVTPRALLDAAEGKPRHIELVALLGYFFSLRPQEVFALRPSDFRAGSAVEQLECAAKMREFGLYSRFAVRVARQRDERGDRPPKARSGGWVACFDAEAARRIVDLMRGHPPDERLFDKSNSWMYVAWHKAGMPCTIKDLRRASLYWLGHHTPFQDAETPLMKHARHRNAVTTRLYLRRPAEELDEFGSLDLDA